MKFLKKINLIKFDTNRKYLLVDTNKIENLSDLTLYRGFISWLDYYWMDDQYKFEEIDIVGYNLNNYSWSPSNGCYSEIYGKQWTKRGNLHGDFGAKINKLKCQKAKFIKFHHETY